MNAKETLSKIAEILGLASEKVNLETMKLEDGVVIEADSFESGNEVFVVTEEERVPLPVGEYVLENGMKLVVSEEGVISEIQEVEVEEENDTEMEYVSKEELAEVKAAIEEMRQAIEAMKPKEEMSAEDKTEEAPKEEPKEELSAEKPKEELSEEVVHSPEAELEKKLGFRMETKKGRSTQDLVFEKLFSN